MLNNPIDKHVCIFEMEHKGHVFTAEIVCMVCGVYLSAQQDRQPGTRRGRTGKSAKSLTFGSSN